MRVNYVRHNLLAVVILLAITLVGCSAKHSAAQRPATQAPAAVPTRDNTLYFIANNHLMALDARSRAVRWTDSKEEFYANSAPVYDNGDVYAATDALFAFNATNGALLWRTAMSETVSSDIILDQGVLYATLEGEQNGAGQVYAVRASDGKILWTYDTHEDNLWSSPVAEDGVIFFASDD
jgi:outer membrane protein assembly factor BamB